MSREQISPDNPVITGNFAHYCGPWEYEKYVKDLFAERGYEMLLPDLPIERSDLTEDDFAEIIRAKQIERGADEYVDLGHSWSGELIYRKLGAAPVSMLIFMGAPLSKVTETAGIPHDKDISHPVEYRALVRAEEAGELDFESARDILGRRFFKNLGDQALRAWATSQLRAHPHKPKHEDDSPDPHAVLPENFPIHYVGFENDNVYYFKSQKKKVNAIQAANPNLTIDFSSIPTGHFPMFEAPEMFVNHIVEIIQVEKLKRRAAINFSTPLVVH